LNGGISGSRVTTSGNSLGSVGSRHVHQGSSVTSIPPGPVQFASGPAPPRIDPYSTVISGDLITSISKRPDLDSSIAFRSGVNYVNSDSDNVTGIDSVGGGTT
jgi:hypothetical protein